MKKLIEFRQKKHKQEVIYKDNGQYLGDIIQDVDGYYYYWPEERGGCWSEFSMLEIAMHLFVLNRIEDHILGYFLSTQTNLFKGTE